MVLLNALLTPDLGLIFWTTVVFLILWFILGKTAWNPITSALKNREASIEEALKQADKARADMANLKSEHLQLLNEAKEERSRMLKEAKDIKDKMITDAKELARVESENIIASAASEIYNQKMAAITEVKNLIGTNAIDLAKKVLARELDTPAEHQAFVADEVKKIILN